MSLSACSGPSPRLQRWRRITDPFASHVRGTLTLAADSGRPVPPGGVHLRIGGHQASVCAGPAAALAGGAEASDRSRDSGRPATMGDGPELFAEQLKLV